MFKNFKALFRINYIRNHYLRFGLSGIVFYIKKLFSKSDSQIIFKHKEYLCPIYLRNNTSDLQAFYQVLYNLEYAIHLDFEPKVIIDLGANCGMASIYFANKFPQAKIIAVEPETENYLMLKKNAQKYEQIITYKKGIWNKTCNLIIQDNGLGFWGFSESEATEQSSNTVSAITLSQIIKDNDLDQIDILKVDIEGAEVELFSKNADEWLAKVRVIIIELHDWLRPGCAKSFFKAISKYDYTYSHKGENEVIYLHQPS